MDQKSSKRKKLADLPPSDDEFWEDADTHLNEPVSVNSEGPHYFDMVHGNEAYCAHCGWGFVLDRGDRVRDGHVYDRQEHLVI
jgi:hypothetical protein